MNELDTRLDNAEARVDHAQAILDSIGHTLEAAKRAQTVAEWAGSAIRSVNIGLVATVVALATMAFVLRRRH